MKLNNIHAVIICYNPNIDTLRLELFYLSNQVVKIWIIDNNSSSVNYDNLLVGGEFQNLEVVRLPSNLGLGGGQNTGIRLARAAGASHILILDQDSQPMSNMVAILMGEIENLYLNGYKIAAVGPVYEDKFTGTQSGFVTLGWFDYKKKIVLPDQDPVEADFIISSGSLIPIVALDEIGMIDDSLFIDHVDTEWCLRARSKGYKLFGIPRARMLHSLGDKRKRVWFLRWRNVPYHSPFRYYYMLRNGVLLQKRPYIPCKWRIGEFMRHWQMLLFFGFWGEGSFKRLAMMLRGLRDGIKGVQGPLRD
jgi:rhamnosyltransferase